MVRSPRAPTIRYGRVLVTTARQDNRRQPDDPLQAGLWRDLRTRLRVVSVAFLLLGPLGILGSATLLIPAVMAAAGGGSTGTFTLTQPDGCDRNPPPRQRCDWFGDFVSDSGRDQRPNMELAGGLPPGAKVGDTVRARDTGSFTQIYPVDDTSGWRLPAIVLTGFLAAFLMGLVVLKPWRWRIRSTGRRSNHSPTTQGSPPP